MFSVPAWSPIEIAASAPTTVAYQRTNAVACLLKMQQVLPLGLVLLLQKRGSVSQLITDLPHQSPNALVSAKVLRITGGTPGECR